MTLAASLNCSPFDIFEKDADEVIMIINFYIRLGNNPQTTKYETKKAVGHNDGFWDM